MKKENQKKRKNRLKRKNKIYKKKKIEFKNSQMRPMSNCKGLFLH
jgi:hypothetical protein